ncbi:MAG: peptide deformylase [Candidatus Parcubacteria bacterium]|nr:peptide deformylase [Candidatus Parcubacteria bacterium]
MFSLIQLSVEGVYGTLKRPEKLTIEALDENGKKFNRGVSGLLAQIIQHEMDHLNGILFTSKTVKLEKI